MNQSIPSHLKLKVVTPHKVLADVTVDEVSLPSLEGYVGILPGHQNLIVALSSGKLCYTRDKKQDCFSISGGYAEVKPDSVMVVTERGKDDFAGPSEERG